MQGLSIESAELLLLIAAVVAIVVRRLRMPYTVGLVLAGLLIPLFGRWYEISLTKQLIFTAFLPPLVFEAAYQIHWPLLRREIPLLAVLTTLGVLIAAAVAAFAMHWLAAWGWQAAILFGILISATDPVAVLALFKELRVEGRLKLLIEAESLLNDGTVAVFFAVAIVAFGGGNIAPGDVLQSFLIIVFGGVACGAAVGLAALLLVGRTDEPLVEILITSVAAFGSFLLADHFGFSGILSTLTAGIVIGNLERRHAFTERGLEALDTFWQFAAFVVNSLVFLLIGMALGRQPFGNAWLVPVIAIVAVLVGRAVGVYLCSAVFWKTRAQVSFSFQHVLVWGGLRGALALALALSLPEDIPERAAIITAAFAVVAFSIVVQGLTVLPLLRKLNVVEVNSI